MFTSVNKDKEKWEIKQDNIYKKCSDGVHGCAGIPSM